MTIAKTYVGCCVSTTESGIITNKTTAAGKAHMQYLGRRLRKGIASLGGAGSSNRAKSSGSSYGSFFSGRAVRGVKLCATSFLLIDFELSYFDLTDSSSFGGYSPSGSGAYVMPSMSNSETLCEGML